MGGNTSAFGMGNGAPEGSWPAERLPLPPEDYWVAETPDCDQQLELDQIVPNADGPVLEGDHVVVRPTRVPAPKGGGKLVLELVAGERIWQAARQEWARILFRDRRPTKQ